MTDIFTQVFFQSFSFLLEKQQHTKQNKRFTEDLY